MKPWNTVCWISASVVITFRRIILFQVWEVREENENSVQAGPSCLPLLSFSPDVILGAGWSTEKTRVDSGVVDDRTIMFRRTSKRVKEVVDKMCLSVVVCLNRTFWGDGHNDTVTEKMYFVRRQLTLMTGVTRVRSSCRTVTWKDEY